MNVLTPPQQTALTAHGNVLVVAGAGTGKTRTLVERCCALLLEERCSLQEILMVTFTEAAAAEMRRRIRTRLMERLPRPGCPLPDQALLRHLEGQLALLDTAHISTLHSLCLKLLREQFHHPRLRLDPEFVVLTEEQVHQLRHQVMDALLAAHYDGDSAEARAFQRLLTGPAGGVERRVHELILQLHRYAQSLADPEAWFDGQLARFDQPDPNRWREWLLAGFVQWRERWLPELEPFAANPNVGACRDVLSDLPASPTLKQIKASLDAVREADESDWPRGSKSKVRKPIEDFFEDAAFFHSLMPAPSGEDPLAQDWAWARIHMQTLLGLAREFGERFSRAKREIGGVDFADLEQFALKLLWDAKAGRPTPIALQWRARLRFVFVDEYQDINAAQDTILRALSREGAEANRFLVGDVKQSIYRFRLADPTIFQHYKKSWEERSGEGRTVFLSDNFRSRETLLDFINPVFASLMREAIGGVGYDPDAHLKFGAPEKRAALSRTANASPQVEIHLRVTGSGDETPERDDDQPNRQAWAELADLESTEKEARLAARRLRQLRDERYQVWDEEAKKLRAVEWGDMVVLLRAPANKAEGFAKEFSKAGVPLHAARGGFYDTTEISDLLSLLQLLDNPLQDIPLLAVLRSPLVGLSLDELAVLRATHRDGHLWAALQEAWLRLPKPDGGVGGIAAAARVKAKAFLDSFAAWRRRARQGALSDCLETILDETHYESLVLAQPRGEERLANVNRLLNLIRQFDPYQRQGLLRFLKFVETQRDAETGETPASAATAGAVRLMSIHQSKGLEFPVVVVADLAKPFNLSDLRAPVLLDAEYGLCPRVSPPERKGHYPSLPYWLAKRRQHAEALGEELRLFYVALTRAKDRLILAGMAKPDATEVWRTGQDGVGIATRQILAGRSYMDWLQLCLPLVTKPDDWTGDKSGENHLACWTLYSENDERLLNDAGQKGQPASEPRTGTTASPVVPDDVIERLTWAYPFTPATRQPAKTSVTALRRQAAEQLDEEASPLFAPLFPRASRTGKSPKLSAADIGTAHHKFLQFVSLEQTDNRAALQEEAERLVRERVLTADEAAALDVEALASFWQSELGRRIRQHAPHVRRELAFTARFEPAELASVGAVPADATLAGEFVVVQGVADLVVLLPVEIWLVDFKTDHFGLTELPEKTRLYAPQLKLYAAALSRIYRRPVQESWLHFLALHRSVALAD